MKTNAAADSNKKEYDGKAGAQKTPQSTPLPTETVSVPVPPVAPPPPQKPEKPTKEWRFPRERRRGSIFWAFLLIFFGVAALLSNFGLLPSNFWSTVWQFWPLLLVFWGLEFFFNRVWIADVLITLVSLVFVVFVIVTSMASASPTFRTELEKRFPAWVSSIISALRTDEQTTQLTVAESDYLGVAKRVLSFDIGTVDLTIVTDDTTDYLNLTANYFKNYGKPTLSQKFDEGILSLAVGTENKTSIFSFAVSNTTYTAVLGQSELPTDITLTIGTGKATVNLEKLNVGKVDIEVGTGKADLAFVEATPSGKVAVDVGTGSVNITLSEGVGFKVVHEIGVGALKVGSETITGDGTYTSSDFENSSNQIEFTTDIGTGSVSIVRE